MQVQKDVRKLKGQLLRPECLVLFHVSIKDVQDVSKLFLELAHVVSCRCNGGREVRRSFCGPHSLREVEHEEADWQVNVEHFNCRYVFILSERNKVLLLGLLTTWQIVILRPE